MSLTYQEEAFPDVQPEIAEMSEDHWNEAVSLNFPVDADWDRYHAIHDIGMLTTITARSGRELAGYVLMMIFTDLHMDVIVTQADMYFMKKKHRKGRAGLLLLKEAEKIMTNKGAKLVTFHESMKVGNGKIFQYLGYRPDAVAWVKEI